jgi:hypothetical protein
MENGKWRMENEDGISSFFILNSPFSIPFRSPVLTVNKNFDSFLTNENIIIARCAFVAAGV